MVNIFRNRLVSSSHTRHYQTKDILNLIQYICSYKLYSKLTVIQLKKLIKDQQENGRPTSLKAHNEKKSLRWINKYSTIEEKDIRNNPKLMWQRWSKVWVNSYHISNFYHKNQLCISQPYLDQSSTWWQSKLIS